MHTTKNREQPIKHSELFQSEGRPVGEPYEQRKRTSRSNIPTPTTKKEGSGCKAPRPKSREEEASIPGPTPKRPRESRKSRRRFRPWTCCRTSCRGRRTRQPRRKRGQTRSGVSSLGERRRLHAPLRNSHPPGNGMQNHEKTSKNPRRERSVVAEVSNEMGGNAVCIVTENAMDSSTGKMPMQAVAAVSRVC